MKKLLDDFKIQNPSFSSIVECSKYPPHIINLRDIFQFSDKELNTYGKSLASYNSGETEVNKYLTKLAWGIRSYIAFQDVFSYKLKSIPKTPEKIFDGHNYCYFESLVYLRQIVLNVVNCLSLSSICMLRPFMELSIYNVYWELNINTNSNKNILSWLNGEIGKPPIKNMIQEIKNNLIIENSTECSNRISNICNSIQQGYNSLSSYEHTPKWNESFGKKIGNLRLTEYEDLLFSIHSMNFALFNIINLYCYTYPMFLFPLDTKIKFGFSPPVGTYNDDYNYHILENYLGCDICKNLMYGLKTNQLVIDLIDFYNSRPNLTEDEISKTFDFKFFKDLTIHSDPSALYDSNKARLRAMILALNYIDANKIVEKENDPNIDLFLHDFYK